jgi:hypothetical protein
VVSVGRSMGRQPLRPPLPFPHPAPEPPKTTHVHVKVDHDHPRHPRPPQRVRRRHRHEVDQLGWVAVVSGAGVCGLGCGGGARLREQRRAPGVGPPPLTAPASPQSPSGGCSRRGAPAAARGRSLPCRRWCRCRRCSARCCWPRRCRCYCCLCCFRRCRCCCRLRRAPRRRHPAPPPGTPARRRRTQGRRRRSLARGRSTAGEGNGAGVGLVWDVMTGRAVKGSHSC